jgi:hypothetical protein
LSTAEKSASIISRSRNATTGFFYIYVARNYCCLKETRVAEKFPGRTLLDENSYGIVLAEIAMEK